MVSAPGNWVVVDVETACREIDLGDAFVLVDGGIERTSGTSTGAFVLVDVAPQEPEVVKWNDDPFVVVTSAGDEFTVTTQAEDFQVLSPTI